MKRVLRRFRVFPVRLTLLIVISAILITLFGCMSGGGGGIAGPAPEDRNRVVERVQAILKALASGDGVALAGFRRSTQSEYLPEGGNFLPLFVHDLGSSITDPNDNATYTFLFEPDEVIYPAPGQALATAWTWFSDGGKVSLKIWLEREADQWYLTELGITNVDPLQAASTGGPLPSSVLWPMARDNRWQFVEIQAAPGASTRPRRASRVSAMVLNATRANFRTLVISGDPILESGNRQSFRLQMSAYEAGVATSQLELPVDPGTFEFGRFSSGVSAVDRGFFAQPSGAAPGASLWEILDPSHQGFVRAFEQSGLYLEGADTSFNEGRPWRLADLLVQDGAAATQSITLSAPGSAPRAGEARILVMESIPVSLPWVQGLARRFDISLAWSGSTEVTWTSLFFLPGMGLIGYADYDLSTRHPIRFAWLWGASVGSREFLPPGDSGALDPFISLVINHPGILQWTVGTPFTQSMTASGGQLPYDWSVSGAPSWLMIEAGTGLLSGTPDQAGSYSFDVAVQDAGDLAATLPILISVATAPAPVVAGITPAEGFQGGSPVSVEITGQNFFGTPQVRFATATALGPTATGLTLIDAGRLSCALPLSGIATGLWSIEVVNSDGQVATGENLFLVRPEPASVPVILEQAAGQADPTNVPSIQYTVVFARPVSGFTAEDISLGGTAAPATCIVAETAPGDGTTFIVTVSGMIGDGTVIASIPENIVIDIEGNGNLPSASTDNQVTFDTTPPTAILDRAPVQPDPASMSPILFQVTFSEPVTGFTSSNVVVPEGLVVSSFGMADPAGLAYEIAIDTGGTGGTVSLAIDPAGVTDASGNALSPVTVVDDSVDFDASFPYVSITQAPSQPDPASGTPISFQVRFSEPVSGFTASDVSLGGTANPTTCIIAQVDAANYLVSVSGTTGDGTVIASIPSRVAFDAVGNGNAPSSIPPGNDDNEVTLDATPPSVVVALAPGQPAVSSQSAATFTVTFSEPVTGFGDAPGDFTMSGPGGTGLPVIAAVSPTTYTVTVDALAMDGPYDVAIPAAAAQDAAGNGNQAISAPALYTLDTLSPSVVVTLPAGSNGWFNGNVITFNVTFSEPVTGFDTPFDDLIDTAPPMDVPPSSPLITAVSPTTYTVQIDTPGDGEYTLTIPADAAVDQAGNLSLAAPDVAIQTRDSVAPTAIISNYAPQASLASTSPVNFSLTFSETVSGNWLDQLSCSGTATVATWAFMTSDPDMLAFTIGAFGVTGSGTVLPALNSTGITDQAGNQLSVSVTASSVSFDNVPPTVTPLEAFGTDFVVISGAPANLVFSEALDAPSRTAVTDALDNARTAGGPASYVWTNNVLTISGDAALDSIWGVSVTVANIKDLFGNNTPSMNLILISAP